MNSRACLNSADSFTNEIESIYYVEEIFEADGTHKVVHEGIKEDNLRSRLMRVIDNQSVSLEWYRKN